MKNIVLAATLVAAAAGSASAATIMQSQPYGPGTPNFTQSLPFNKFDGTLGTLLSVKIKVELAITGGFLQLDNDGPLGANGSANLGAKTVINGVGVPVLDAGFNNVIGAGVSVANASPFAIAGNDGDDPMAFNAGGPDFFDFQGQPGNDMRMGFIGAIFHGNYTDANGVAGGLDAYGIDVDVTQIFDYGAIGGIQFSGGPVTASGTVMVTYEYEPVPAPGAAALLGLGGLLVARRRR